MNQTIKFDWSIYKGNLKWLPEQTIYSAIEKFLLIRPEEVR